MQSSFRRKGSFEECINIYRRPSLQEVVSIFILPHNIQLTEAFKKNLFGLHKVATYSFYRFSTNLAPVTTAFWLSPRA
jgi:hypothetical protein